MVTTWMVRWTAPCGNPSLPRCPQVTDVMDIDRTPELLAWVFGSLFGRKVRGRWTGSAFRGT